MHKKLWLAASILAASLPVGASTLFQPVEVSDQELAQLRGRYVLPDRIISFGVVMTSTWQNSAGQVIGAEVALNVANGQIQPSLYVRQISSPGNGNVTAGSGTITGGAGLENVQGIVQSVRTAGDLNTGLNDLRLRITTGNGDVPVDPDAQPWNGSQDFSNAAGLVHVSTRAGGISIALNASQGQGSSSQQIGGGVAQHANISGTLNNVRNLAALNVALRDNPRNLNLENCIEQIRALRPHGY
ncbi:hypothetical protein SAMN05216601_103387 [Ectopseudomonas composti]|uniref:Fap system outer membrane protein n=1 Tax=Ectopseudomonas composti TaxID=658457 RepID=A0A1I5L6Y9_9GAMM|nr:hypothetical protein [Pseudomonas composti]SFO93109.1 hypothetical protein SAMN05216601_103387 [Pseudomonas composti]